MRRVRHAMNTEHELVFALSYPVQVSVAGMTTAFMVLLALHQCFTAAYHFPLDPLNFVLQLGILHYRDIGAKLGHPPSRSGNDLYARVLGWRELGRALQPVTQEQGGLPILS